MELPEGFALRAATPADSKFVYQLKKAAYREYVELTWGWDEQQQLDYHQKQFRTENLWIVQSVGRDVGVLRVIRDPHSFQVEQIFILPEFQNQGVGGAFMMAIFNEASSLRLPVRLRVLKVNDRAIAFYKRLGFVESGGTNTHVMMEKLPAAIV